MKSIKYLILIIPLYIFLTLPVFAQGNGPGGAGSGNDNGAKKEEMMEAKEDRMEEKQQAKDERMAQRCEQMQQRAAERRMKFQENVDIHVENYRELISRLREISTTLSTRFEGLDTSSFDTLIDDMEAMVDSYEENYGTFLATVEVIADESSDTCGDGMGNKYSERLQAARTQLLAAINERQAIRSLYAHEIRQAIWDLRDQIKDIVGDVEETVEDSMESEE